MSSKGAEAHVNADVVRTAKRPKRSRAAPPPLPMTAADPSQEEAPLAAPADSAKSEESPIVPCTPVRTNVSFADTLAGNLSSPAPAATAATPPAAASSPKIESNVNPTIVSTTPPASSPVLAPATASPVVTSPATAPATAAATVSSPVVTPASAAVSVPPAVVSNTSQADESASTLKSEISFALTGAQPNYRVAAAFINNLFDNCNDADAVARLQSDFVEAQKALFNYMLVFTRKVADDARAKKKAIEVNRAREVVKKMFQEHLLPKFLENANL